MEGWEGRERKVVRKTINVSEVTRSLHRKEAKG